MIDAAKFEQLTQSIPTEMHRLHIPGIAIGVYLNGECLTAGYGVTNLENPLPVDADSIFQVESITKTFTATAIMRMLDAEKLDLDKPIRTWLPNLRLADPEVTEKVSTPNSPPEDSPPPSRLALFAPDHVLGLDEPFKNNQGEFLRDAQGKLTWFRCLGRVHRRL